MFSYPLTRPNRLIVARTFAEVPTVDISINCAVEDQMGSVFVDSPENPQLFMLEQDHFFAYFAGDLTTEAGSAFLSQITGGRMLMAGAAGWYDAVQSLFGERLINLDRHTYASDSLSAAHLQTIASANSHSAAVQRVDVALLNQQSPYIEIGAFESAEDFVQRGIGFCLVKADIIVGAAYSSLVCSNAIEVSIVVDPAWRRQGVATALACALLQWCLDRHIAPHWDAANEESCLLAEKLGYSQKTPYRAYFLKPTDAK